MTLTSTSPGISSVVRVERFENNQPKQVANRVCRDSFDLDCTGLVIGLLGISDVKYYTSMGFEQDQIISVEKVVWPNHDSLRNDLNKAGYGAVRVIRSDVFDYIRTLENGSISALYLDLWGFADLCPNLQNKDRNRHLNVICAKLADDFHFQFTYEDQRSRSIWLQKAKEHMIDSDRSNYVFNTCNKLLSFRDIKVANLVSQKYPGILSDGRTCRMVTSSFVGSLQKNTIEQGTS